MRQTGERGHDCPVCRAPLTGAVLDDRRPTEICDQCKRILMPLHTSAETVTARRHAARTPSVTPAPADRAEFERRLGCPECGAPMITDWYYGPGNIVIDTCERAASCGWMRANWGEPSMLRGWIAK